MAQYIDKSALVAEIKRRKEINKYRDTNDSLFEDEAILSFINTLEVKEVDLEKEVDKWWWGSTWQSYGMILNQQNIMDFAKHFFELGLKVAQKGNEHLLCTTNNPE